MKNSVTITPAIVVVAYNRENSLRRLLNSISNASFSVNSIPMIISIDGEAPDTVIAIAKDFHWSHGDKRIINHDHRLGLKEHIFACGNLTSQYGTVIILEDDLLVSPGFYDFDKKAAEFFDKEQEIAGISL